jgi:hypothetical protein
VKLPYANPVHMVHLIQHCLQHGAELSQQEQLRNSFRPATVLMADALRKGLRKHLGSSSHSNGSSSAAGPTAAQADAAAASADDGTPPTGTRGSPQPAALLPPHLAMSGTATLPPHLTSGAPALPPHLTSGASALPPHLTSGASALPPHMSSNAAGWQQQDQQQRQEQQQAAPDEDVWSLLVTNSGQLPPSAADGAADGCEALPMGLPGLLGLLVARRCARELRVHAWLPSLFWHDQHA